MAQTTIQGSFLGDGTVTGVKIGADFISAQTELDTTLATTDEIIVSDAGVIKRIDISVWSASTETFTNKTLTAPIINAGTLNLMTVLTVANDIDVGAFEIKALKFESDQATGTAPLTVASTTVVTNLNADLLDGVQGALYSQIAAAETLLQKTLTSPVLNTGVSGSAILDEDNLATNSATQLATQQSIKAYVDNLSTGTDWQAVKTSAFDAVAGEGYAVNTNSGAITCTLPDAASAGDTIEFIDYSRNFAVNNLTLDQNGVNFQGRTTPNPVYDVAGQSIRLVYVDSTQGWIPTSDDDVTLETITPPYTVEYLVIAGGGSGGVGASSGGGGAGGYRNSYGSETSGGGGGSETGFTAVTSTVYTVVIGGGGTAQSGSGGQGTSSSIAGTSVSISTVGGGDGGDRSNTSGPSGRDGADGGSGGGGGTTTGDATTTAGGSGTANQGYDGGTGQHETGSHEGAGGGGGAGVA